mgnify:CR=1 FL=1
MKKTVYEWLMAVGHRAGCHQRALERHEVSAVCPMHRRSGGIYSCCADICGLQKEYERVRRLLYSVGDRRFNATVGVAGVYQS